MSSSSARRISVDEFRGASSGSPSRLPRPFRAAPRIPTSLARMRSTTFAGALPRKTSSRKLALANWRCSSRAVRAPFRAACACASICPCGTSIERSKSAVERTAPDFGVSPARRVTSGQLLNCRCAVTATSSAVRAGDQAFERLFRIEPQIGAQMSRAAVTISCSSAISLSAAES